MRVEKSNILPPSDLILNEDGTIYHLGLLPEQVAPLIITVGDPDRVSMVSAYFDLIEHKVSRREFCTHTGRLGSKRVTVLSTGMGTDNIDIAMHELDYLFNVDLASRKPVSTPKSLRFIRLGTTGTLQRDIVCGTPILSRWAMAHDGLDRYYEDGKEEMTIAGITKDPLWMSNSYLTSMSNCLYEQLDLGFFEATTYTAQGFYGPQLRRTRRLPAGFRQKVQRSTMFTNVEMETAGIYLIARHLGHEAISVSTVLANRATGEFSKSPQTHVLQMIEKCLSKIESL